MTASLEAVPSAPPKPLSHRPCTSRRGALPPLAASNRHVDRCFFSAQATLRKAAEAAEPTRSSELLAKIADFQANGRPIAAKAEKSNDLRTAIVAIRELSRIVELLGKFRGEL